MELLPKWCLPFPVPSVFDTDSKTVLEQTARVYGAMQTLIKEYNDFADAANRHIEEYMASEQEDRKEFEANMTKVLREFICSIEERYLDLGDLAREMINQAINSGTIGITAVYDPKTEALSFVAKG